MYIEGHLQTRSWEDQTGKKNYRTEIVADNMIMLSGGPGAGDAPAKTTFESAGGKAKAAETLPTVQLEDEGKGPAKSDKKTVTVGAASGKSDSKSEDETISIEDIPF